MKVTPDHADAAGAADDIRDPLAGWGRTARLCVIRLAEAAAPAVPVLIWLGIRR